MPRTKTPPSDAEPHIGILLATYNGAACLQEQLDSLAAQRHKNWELVVSDDASRDDTRAILDQFGKHYPVTVLSGPEQGPAANFMSLITRSRTLLPENSWLAFCDQDDVWLPDRLTLGCAALTARPDVTPALYCSRTWVVNEDLNGRTLSAARPKPPSFLNALAQNIAGGNTILLNAAGAELLMDTADAAGEVVMHDWWAYQMITGAGGDVVHDDTPTLLYRQHMGNEVGANTGWWSKWRRLVGMLRGDFREWNDINLRSLHATRAQLTPQAQRQVDSYARLRRLPFFQRLIELGRLGIYRQSKSSTLALWVAACLRRL